MALNNVFLLRKSKSGQAVVLKDDDFPLRFCKGGKTYVVETTKAGKVIMKTE